MAARMSSAVAMRLVPRSAESIDASLTTYADQNENSDKCPMSDFPRNAA
jgi:hypothetical protein